MSLTVQEDERPHRGNTEDQHEKAEENLRLELQRCHVPSADADGPSHLREICGDYSEKDYITESDPRP